MVLLRMARAGVGVCGPREEAGWPPGTKAQKRVVFVDGAEEEGRPQQPLSTGSVCGRLHLQRSVRPPRGGDRADGRVRETTAVGQNAQAWQTDSGGQAGNELESPSRDPESCRSAGSWRPWGPGWEGSVRLVCPLLSESSREVRGCGTGKPLRGHSTSSRPIGKVSGWIWGEAVRRGAVGARPRGERLGLEARACCRAPARASLVTQGPSVRACDLSEVRGGNRVRDSGEERSWGVVGDGVEMSVSKAHERNELSSHGRPQRKHRCG